MVEVDVEEKVKKVVSSECILEKYKSDLYDDVRLEKCKECKLYNDGECDYEIVELVESDRSSETESDPYGGLPSSTYKWAFDCPVCGTERGIRIVSGNSSLTTVSGFTRYYDEQGCSKCKTVFIPYDKKFSHDEGGYVVEFIVQGGLDG